MMSWAAVAGAAITLVGGAINNSQSKKAAKAQQSAVDSSTQLQQYIYDQTRADQEPWRQAGTQALGALLSGMGLDSSGLVKQNLRTREGFDSGAYLAQNPDIASSEKYRSNPYQHWLDWGQNEGREFTYTPAAQAQLSATNTGAQADGYGDLTRRFTLADFTADPGYQFRLGEGQNAIERSAAARGGALGGGALKAIQQYGQNFASNEYGNAYNRFVGDQTNRFNRLSSLAGLGQTANGALQTAGSNYATAVGNNNAAAANATGASYIASGNAINNTLGSLSSMYALNSMLNRPKNSTQTG